MMIEAIKVEKSFGKYRVLDGISLTIPENMIFCLLGASGSGKTTLLRTIMGAMPVDAGTITVDGIAVPNRKILDRIGFMPQQDAVYNELSVWDNLRFFAGIQKVTRRQFKERAEKLLDIVGLTDKKQVLVRNCSGGMKKRLSLAAALLHNPSILILDEPTVGIDPVLRRGIWEYLKILKEQGTTIVVTTHVMDEVAECDEAALLREGQIIQSGSIRKLMSLTESGKIEELFFLDVKGRE